MDLTHGIRDNLEQFLHQLLQVLLVGFTIGMMRTVVPALAESEFGVPKPSFLLLTAFVVAFGFVKGSLNFVAGRLSERIGRKAVVTVSDLPDFIKAGGHIQLVTTGSRLSFAINHTAMKEQGLQANASLLSLAATVH